MGSKAVIGFVYSTCIAITAIFCLALILNHANMKYKYFTQTFSAQTQHYCDLFEGQWIPDPAAPLYTNYSCKTIPLSKNCLFHGRKDTDFLHWRWKPNKCELPRFTPDAFLSILRGKNMAFISDSFARNQMESLLCLLSTVETPKSVEKDAENRFTTWEFPKHKFKLTSLWSQFLVEATEIFANGTATGNFDLHLDRVDTRWSEKLSSIDYAVFSTGHWFVRPNYLYEGGNLIGCVFCSGANLTDFGPGFSIGRALRAALQAVNEGEKKTISFVSTYSPPHFENGEWNNGGNCNRTRPMGRGEVDRTRPEWEYRRIQVEEVETAKMNGRNEFEIIDVTEVMSVRADGHPDLHWKSGWENYYRDCAHWCMPGPIDTWNELLLQRIKNRPHM